MNTLDKERLEEQKLLQKRMLQEDRIVEIYQKEGIPFVVLPVLSKEQHTQILELRDKIIDGKILGGDKPPRHIKGLIQ